MDENGKFKSGDQIFQLLGGRTNWIIEYKTILKAIPKLWKEKTEKLRYVHKGKKKEIKPFMEIDKKNTYDLPDKARDYHKTLMQSSKCLILTCFLSWKFENVNLDRMV